MFLTYISRRFLRYVYRSVKNSFRSRYRVPNIFILLAISYLVAVFLTVNLVSPQTEKPWLLRDTINFKRDMHPLLPVTFLPPVFTDGKQRKSINRGTPAAAFDPRLVPALWLHSVRLQLHGAPLGLAAEVSLPFRWDSLLDLLPRLASPPFAPAQIDSCLDFRSAFHIAHSTDEFCEEKPESHKVLGLPGVKITRPTDEALDERARVFLGANYLVHLETVPKRAVLLGVGPETDGKRLSLVIPFSNIPSEYQRLDLVLLVESYLETCPQCETISVSEQLQLLQDTWTESDGQVSFHTGFDAEHDALRIESAENFGASLETSDFAFSQDQLQSYFNHRAHKPHNTADNLDKQLAVNINLQKYHSPSEKYFHEANLLGTSRGSHFDWRFFKKSQYSQYEHQAILHRLTRAWLRFSALAGMKTWVAHGSLLGWYWNGFNMPWDLDLDVQMTMQSLFLLARNYNQLVVVDMSDNTTLGGVHLYFVDVSPYVYDREHGDGKNVIDARFIDTESGMYVDITGLAVSDDFKTTFNETLVRSGRQLHDIFDQEYENVIKSATSEPEIVTEYVNTLRTLELAEWEARRVYNCKNFHYYHIQELEPLLKTTFEGEVAFVPAKFEQILQREYKKGMTAQEYGNWIFRPFLGLWVHRKTCKNDYKGTNCHDPEVHLEEMSTRPMRLLRKAPKELDTLQLLRPDPWLMAHNEKLHAWK